MVTTAQLVANRKNAKKGGVKTAAGKAISRYNARKHGLLSKELLLPTEDANELSKFKTGIVSSLKPQDEIQNTLVDIIVSCFWRKQRALSYERRSIDSGQYFHIHGLIVIPCDTITRYEAALDKQMFRTLSALKELQKTH